MPGTLYANSRHLMNAFSFVDTLPYDNRLEFTHLEEVLMPYESIDELPESMRNSLPVHAQEIDKEAFNSAWE